MKGFVTICEAITASEYCYVGDNPKKDFIAPNALGWTTIMLKADERNIHEQVLEPDPSTRPDHVIENLLQLKSLIEC